MKFAPETVPKSFSPSDPALLETQKERASCWTKAARVSFIEQVGRPSWPNDLRTSPDSPLARLRTQCDGSEFPESHDCLHIELLPESRLHWEVKRDAVFRKPDARHKRYRLFAGGAVQAFDIIADCHVRYDHQDAQKTFSEVGQYAYGCTQREVALVTESCSKCQRSSVLEQKRITRTSRPLESVPRQAQRCNKGFTQTLEPVSTLVPPQPRPNANACQPSLKRKGSTSDTAFQRPPKRSATKFYFPHHLRTLLQREPIPRNHELSEEESDDEPDCRWQLWDKGPSTLASWQQAKLDSTSSAESDMVCFVSLGLTFGSGCNHFPAMGDFQSNRWNMPSSVLTWSKEEDAVSLELDSDKMPRWHRILHHTLQTGSGDGDDLPIWLIARALIELKSRSKLIALCQHLGCVLDHRNRSPNLQKAIAGFVKFAHREGSVYNLSSALGDIDGLRCLRVRVR